MVAGSAPVMRAPDNGVAARRCVGCIVKVGTQAHRISSAWRPAATMTRPGFPCRTPLSRSSFSLRSPPWTRAHGQIEKQDRWVVGECIRPPPQLPEHRPTRSIRVSERYAGGTGIRGRAWCFRKGRGGLSADPGHETTDACFRAYRQPSWARGMVRREIPHLNGLRRRPRACSQPRPNVGGYFALLVYPKSGSWTCLSCRIASTIQP